MKPSDTQVLADALGAFARRARRMAVVGSVAWALALACGWLLAVGMTDRTWGLPRGVRVTALAMLVAVMGTWIVVLVRRWRRPWDTVAVAAAAEAGDERLCGKWTTVTTQHRLPPAQRGSAALTAQLAREVAVAVRDRPPHRRLRWRHQWPGLTAAALSAGLLGALTIVPSLGLSQLLLRQLLPLSDVPRVAVTRINVISRDLRAARGEPVTILAEIVRPTGPAEVLLFFDPARPPEIADMTRSEGDRFALSLTAAGEMTYRVRSGDAVSEAYAIKALPPKAPASRPVATQPGGMEKTLGDYFKAVDALRRGKGG